LPETFTRESEKVMTIKTPSKTTNKYSPEVRERAVRMVLDHAGNHTWRW
jgi:transposase-like protein